MNDEINDESEYQSNPVLASLAEILEILNRALLNSRISDQERIDIMRAFASDYRCIAELGREESGKFPKGVQRTPAGKFRARIYKNGELISLGVFDTPTEASEAYQQARAETPPALRSVKPSIGKEQAAANAGSARYYEQEAA